MALSGLSKPYDFQSDIDEGAQMGVRCAFPEDKTPVIALWRTCELVASYNDPSRDFQFALTGACSEVLVNEHDSGRIYGTIMVGHDATLYYVATARQTRGQGLGRTMVQAGEEWLRERGVKKAQLLIRKTNTGVVAFYERLGFEIAPRLTMSKVVRLGGFRGTCHLWP